MLEGKNGMYLATFTLTPLKWKGNGTKATKRSTDLEGG